MKKNGQENMRKIVFLIGVIWLSLLPFQINSSSKQSDFESKLPWIKKEDTVNNIRVLLRSNGFQNITHEEVIVSSNNGLKIIGVEDEIIVSGEQQYKITPEQNMIKNGMVRVQPLVETEEVWIHSLQRGLGLARYQGILDLYATAEGIVVVNELPVEVYLEHVVPSEMPVSYEMEALKVQAVCARSYAYRQMQGMAYPEYGANVDDSTSFQVYGNSEKQEKTTLAVRETAGEVVGYKNEVAATYFFSTSCGKTTDTEAWNLSNNEDYPYLKHVEVNDEENDDYERSLPWYRWWTRISKKQVENWIELEMKTEIGELTSLEVTKVGAGGVVCELKAVGTQGKLVIMTENKIRKALGDTSIRITRNDGSIVQGSDLLPSAFFTIEESGDDYILKGGGYGHGIGMSQNGANEMAKRGVEYKEILSFFYPGTVILYGV